MLTRTEFIKDRSQVNDKALGALAGLAIGDSLGDAARSEKNRADYGITTDFNRGASWSTDDTEFALLTANVLIEGKGSLTKADVAQAWLQHVAVQDELKRGGASEIEAANNLRRGIMPPESGRFNTAYLSDGAAMRIAPVGIVCAGDPERAARLAEEDACVSHYMDGIWGAQAVAAAVSVAMVGGTMEEILDVAMAVVPKDSWFYASTMRAFELVERHQGDVLSCWMPLHDELWTCTRASVPEAVAEAFACLRLCHDDFRKGVVLAANFSRDADTIGVIAGTILGAMHGASGIPPHWIDKTRYPTGTCLRFTLGQDIRTMADALAELIC